MSNEFDDTNVEEVADGIRGEKAKTRKGNLILKKREGEYQEGSKNCLFICSNKRTEELKNLMHDIYIIQKPYTCYMPKLHPQLVNITEKIDKIVDICIHNTCSFFFSIFSTKKNPSRFILGRLYNNKILDYYTFSLLSYIPMSIFPSSKEVLFSTKPIVLIQGSYFNMNENTKYLKNILFDFFKHKNVESFTKNSLQRLVVITAYENTGETPTQKLVSAPGQGEESGEHVENETNEQNKESETNEQNKESETNEQNKESEQNEQNKESEQNEQNGKAKKKRNKYVMSFRQYIFKKGIYQSEEENDSPKLEEVGPRFEFTLESSQIPNYNLFQEAIKKYDIHPKRKEKKIKTDELGHDIKRVYVQKQDFNKLHTKHSNLFKKSKKFGKKNKTTVQ
ncbi:nucleolar preribosomal assembly protein, putative [Plasmodium vinckei brucechwatti]|uniref:Ribosome production factor 2 homolog n=1 Tax=Plasmodium vinckei brucechwatti TaxID=119398 RepID=A0A6V7RY48_PLAVN|nr:nucleolar preribosomal assembly protein, putative [Plasmodium vinckei brucechwatti]